MALIIRHDLKERKGLRHARNEANKEGNLGTRGETGRHRIQNKKLLKSIRN